MKVLTLPPIALRLYPQLPVNVRFATRTSVLPRGGGPDGKSPVLLRKGVGLGWSTYHLHRNEDIYGPDARVYRPSRWEDGELVRKAGLGGFLDFHAGPRVCLGSKCYYLLLFPYTFQFCHYLLELNQSEGETRNI